MRFALTEDHVAFAAAVRDLLAKECSPAVVRAAWQAPVGGLDRGVWDSLDSIGVLGVLVPEADGGLGLDETFMVPILEECGRVALPHPIVETAMVAAPLLGASSGMVTTNLGGPHVACAADADRHLLHYRGGLWSGATSELELEPIDTVDLARRAARVTSPASVALVTDDPLAIDLARDRGTLGTAAVLVGLAQAMLELTVVYVKDRHQFGRPIGTFQAVKHHLADAALAIEFARPALWRAAWSIAKDQPTRLQDVALAKAMANDAAEVTARKALQCHGAVGYTTEADLHLYMKRSWALTRAWGGTDQHIDCIAAALRTSTS